MAEFTDSSPIKCLDYAVFVCVCVATKPTVAASAAIYHRQLTLQLRHPGMWPHTDSSMHLTDVVRCCMLRDTILTDEDNTKAMEKRMRYGGAAGAFFRATDQSGGTGEYVLPPGVQFQQLTDSRQ
jgi:hypothetical protein